MSLTTGGSRGPGFSNPDSSQVADEFAPVMLFFERLLAFLSCRFTITVTRSGRASARVVQSAVRADAQVRCSQALELGACCVQTIRWRVTHSFPRPARRLEIGHKASHMHAALGPPDSHGRMPALRRARAHSCARPKHLFDSYTRHHHAHITGNGF